MCYVTAGEAERELALWARLSQMVADQRGEVVRRALAAGVSKQRVYVLTGIARTTINRIVEEGQR